MSSSSDDGPKLNVDDLLFFPAKVSPRFDAFTLSFSSLSQELNETNIAGRRSPPQKIRLAIGRHGVYKFESQEDKVIIRYGFV